MAPCAEDTENSWTRVASERYPVSIPVRIAPGFPHVRKGGGRCLGRWVFSGCSSVLRCCILNLIHEKIPLHSLFYPSQFFFNPQPTEVTVAERLARSPPTKANRGSIPGRWESCQTMPLAGGFSRGSPVSPAPSFRRHSIFTSITIIGSQDLAVKSDPNLFTRSANCDSRKYSYGVHLSVKDKWFRDVYSSLCGGEENGLDCGGEAVRLPSPTQANRVQSPAGSFPDFRKWESCRTMPLVAGFLEDLAFPPPLQSGATPFSPHFTLIGSQDLVVKSSPNLSIQLHLAYIKNEAINGNTTHLRGFEMSKRKQLSVGTRSGYCAPDMRTLPHITFFLLYKHGGVQYCEAFSGCEHVATTVPLHTLRCQGSKILPHHRQQNLFSHKAAATCLFSQRNARNGDAFSAMFLYSGRLQHLNSSKKASNQWQTRQKYHDGRASCFKRDACDVMSATNRDASAPGGNNTKRHMHASLTTGLCCGLNCSSASRENPARFPRVKIWERLAENRPPFALVTGEYSDHYTTAAPAGKMPESGSNKVDTDMHEYPIAVTRKAPSWRAVFSSYCDIYGTLSSDPYHWKLCNEVQYMLLYAVHASKTDPDPGRISYTAARRRLKLIRAESVRLQTWYVATDVRFPLTQQISSLEVYVSYQATTTRARSISGCVFGNKIGFLRKEEAVVKGRSVGFRNEDSSLPPFPNTQSSLLFPFPSRRRGLIKMLRTIQCGFEGITRERFQRNRSSHQYVKGSASAAPPQG
ncbi:hypothetical protein PR048_014367 [Dryococelus australis]|uniref:Uncharacterized protein n=1 Tax=Dryococelus australis TaxID=614101 RepID=A0ABQ9HDZ8_9NEOP|nr:hypothetical protein PR048_014367 [Dryococelus australis]